MLTPNAMDMSRCKHTSLCAHLRSLSKTRLQSLRPERRESTCLPLTKCGSHIYNVSATPPYEK